ncbi:hypothetical protein TWF569_004923 [Orbilia oligospora]|uniref:Cytochrome b5 heme-binding domain-containing protein n=1 Tax=Orbilia oligospora TaxID=2813651 RepID=A0A4Z0XGM2_ORBOL|nr:hypothetical protein TWF103_004015 [Orbilia oligospora]KAF3092349.1 hypothetical protein TWF102_008433 [Orbilia oligospora]KAF3109565.1 hypothetical protein TWF706_001429 [Orbilia oligospora]KAF3119730.1 hypothetical protein TWF703_003082 [Orbilia oligospora]KAF3122961.1 hypothetical protein TWF594_002576 [Orbilia oligospora]
MATETKEYTYADVAAHDTKESMYVVIDDKVYDVSPFVDEHPGGEEVMLDVAGQDGTEAFEDVGHSDEAREILSKYLIGNLKRSENDPKPIKISQAATSSSGESSGGLPGIVYAVLAAALAAGGYYYLQLQQQQASA